MAMCTMSASQQMNQTMNTIHSQSVMYPVIGEPQVFTHHADRKPLTLSVSAAKPSSHMLMLLELHSVREPPPKKKPDVGLLGT